MVKKSEDAIFSARQAKSGAKGGNTTFKKHGSTYFSQIAKRRWAKERKQRVDK